MPTDDTINQLEGRAIVWRDRRKTLHLCEGADIVRGVRLYWSRCGQHDIPAGQAWLRRPCDTVDCRECLDVVGVTPRDTIIRHTPTDTAPTIGGASAPIVFCAPETAPGVRIETFDLWSRVSGAWKGLS